MTGPSARWAWAAAVACVAAAIAVTAARQTAPPPGLHAGPSAAALVAEGALTAAPADTSGFVSVPPPGTRNVRNEAQATVAPWVDSNGWRFQRGLTKVIYDNLPEGAAPLAAAEAFAFGAEAILHPHAADLDELGRMARFLAARGRMSLPALANIGVVDDGSPAMSEVLNMLTRRNLLYRIVPRGDTSLDITMDVGTATYPRDRLRDPSDLAARAREALGDDRRLVRVYGTTTVIARLTADDARARLALLSYSRNRRQPAIRIRLLGRYEPSSFAAFGAGDNAALEDLRQTPDGATEFSVPSFSTIAIVDLARSR